MLSEKIEVVKRVNKGNNKGSNSYDEASFESLNMRLDFTEKGFREKGILRDDLILKEAKQIARDLYNMGKGLSNSQLRAFFNEVKAIQSRINKDEKLFESNYPFILMLKAKADYKYRSGDKTAKITENFYYFINAGVDYIIKNKSLQAFEDFATLFEVVVGYFYGLGGSR